jgi:hypothetical protein
MSALIKLFRSPAARPTARKSRLGVQALEGREVPATFTVTTFDDVVNPFDGKLSLREAITRANINPGADTIQLKTGVYHVSRTGADNTNVGGDFDVTGSLTIVGTGSSSSIIGAANSERLFDLFGKIDVKFKDLALVDGGNPSSNGGAVQALTANVTLDHVNAARNSGLRGGAINVETGNVTVLASRLGANAVSGQGGAIHVGTGKVFVDQSEIFSNSATVGGGIAVEHGKLTVARSDIHDNAANSGGGINTDGATVALSNTFVRNNVANGDGGGLRVFAAVTADGSQITGNTARTSGGGIAAIAANLIRSTVSDNHTLGFGGGISANAATLDHTVVSDNSADGDGGGLYILGGTARLTASTVHGNRAVTGGGGGIAATTAALVASTVDNNSSHLFGGGLSAVTATLTNSTISGNTTNTTGGGIHLERGGTILNSTIAFNHADGFGGGIENVGGVPVRVKNTIIAQNNAVHFGQDVLGLFDSLGHNLVQDPNSGNANTDFTDPFNLDILGVDPKLGALSDNGGPTRTHALLAGSLAIDHGSNSGAPTTDQRGVARPRDGDHNGSRIVDIGAFEL